MPGPAVIRTQTVRTGRTLSTGQASLFQYAEDGSEVERIRVLATYGDLDHSPTTSAPRPSRPPCPTGTTASARATARPGSRQLRHHRPPRHQARPGAVGWAVGAPSGKGEMRGWFGLADGRDPDPLSLLLTVDALPPTSFELGLTGWTPPSS